MRVRVLGRLVGAELSRARGPLVTAGVGIALGVAALVFFLALGFGARAVLLGEVFPIDRVELEPKKSSPGVLGALFGALKTPGIAPDVVDTIRSEKGVVEVSPKLSFRFPASARGGEELLGRQVGTSELIGDGIEPGLVEPDLQKEFQDPLPPNSNPPSCKSQHECSGDQYCERPSGMDAGRCSAPIPVLVSRYLVEIFDHAIAPAHGLPPLAGTMLERAKGVTFEMTLGSSLLGVSRTGKPRVVQMRLVGVSDKAIDLGVTLPIDVVRRFNAEYSGKEAATRYSSLVVRTASPEQIAPLVDRAQKLGLVPKDTSARDVSALITAILALLVLVAAVVLVVAAINISHTFRVMVAERRREIGLYRALGASAGDIQGWIFATAIFVGAVAGCVGIAVAWLAAQLVDWRAAVDLPDFPFKPDSFFVFPAELLLGALGFAVAFAAFGAAIPALRAARTDPALLLDSDGER